MIVSDCMTAAEVRDALFRWTLNPEVETAEAAIARMDLAFAVLEEVEAAAQDSPMTSLKECVEARGFLASARARLEAKPDADDR